MINDLNYKVIEFPVSKKDFSKTEMKKKSLYQFFLLWKQTELSNSHIRSKIGKLNGFVAYFWWK